MLGNVLDRPLLDGVQQLNGVGLRQRLLVGLCPRAQGGGGAVGGAHEAGAERRGAEDVGGAVARDHLLQRAVHWPNVRVAKAREVDVEAASDEGVEQGGGRGGARAPARQVEGLAGVEGLVVDGGDQVGAHLAEAHQREDGVEQHVAAGLRVVARRAEHDHRQAARLRLVGAER